MKLLHKVFGVLALLILLPFDLAFAEDSIWAEPLVGHTTVETGGRIYYDGMGGNEVILNHDPNLELGFRETLPGLSPLANTIEKCTEQISVSPFNLNAVTRCFFLDDYKYLLLTSRTSKGNSVELETAALIYDKWISGDVAGINDPSANFALYGRNLNVNSSRVSNATWDTRPNYLINPAAQASFADGSASKAYFDNHREDLYYQAKNIVSPQSTLSPGSSPSSRWYLLASDINVSAGATTGNLTYPEGKLWSMKGFTLTGNRTYLGRGTLVLASPSVTSPVTLNNTSLVIDGSLLKSGNSSLGIIVFGDVTIKSGSKVEAAIFATGRMTIQSNVELSGSFVANDFSYGASGIRIDYDPALEQQWPPGFRFFNMPTAKNTAP